jgi:tRNA 2-selenouridine synthase
LKPVSIVNVSQLDQFDQLIDVRSPSEFALDRVPGAINLPVLDDAEREQVGTQYKQESSFAAKKTGAALVARNIARHIETELHNRPKDWQPLIYCWRGGNRSASLAHVLRQIGWTTHTLDGGYKAYRRRLVSDLETLPAALQFRVVCGPTGSGKSRVLQRLAALGAQVLDLEDFAVHRGSVLGNLPDRPQPTQKLFESSIWHALRKFTPERPIYVEAESKKIGLLRVPETLISRMWESPCLRIEVPLAGRVDFLKRDYQHFLHDFAELKAKLECLVPLHGNSKIAHWLELAAGQRWDELVDELLVRHYDPAYQRSTKSHFPDLDRAQTFHADRLDEPSLDRLAKKIWNEMPGASTAALVAA